MEHEDIPAGEIESLPVFPMPTTVLFPGIVLPLHIDDPPYSDMVSDAMADNQTLAVVMIKPGTEGDDIPQVCDVGGIGQIIHCEKLIGGRYNVLIQGIGRVQLLEELPRQQAYRRFKARVFPQPTDQDAAAVQNELLRLESAVISLVASVAETDAQLVEVVHSTNDPIHLADILSATVVRDAEVQQELLATHDLKARLARLIDVVTDVLVNVGEIPPEAQAN
ncbi:LON peptidase substrate-binding domain-containing protein [Myxococcota bacterium]